ncbi:hypothetical protein BSKO_12179 [Bryopsis sp. KO-2023]|nr:hypothetical protein BSKO_12179 [Bryopsis sp. KO-2023]
MLWLRPPAHQLWRCTSSGNLFRMLQIWELAGCEFHGAASLADPLMRTTCFSLVEASHGGIEPQGKRGFRVDPRGMSEEDIVVEKFKTIVAKRASEIEKGDVAVEAMRSVSQLTPYSIANIFNCCKRGNFSHKGLFELMIQWVKMYGDTMIQGFSTIEITMTIQSIGMLAHRERMLNKARLDKFPDAIEKPVNRSFFLGCKEFIVDLLREFIRRDSTGELDLDARGVADIIHGIGLWFHKKEGKPLDKPAVHAVDIALRLLATERVFEHCSPLDLSNVCFGLGCMEHTDEPTLVQILNRADREFKGVTPVRSDGINKWKCQKAQQNDDSLDAQCISNIVWGLGKVGCYHEGVLDSLGREIVKVLKDVDEKSLANIMYGFGLLGYRKKNVVGRLSVEIGHPTHMMHYREMDLANILYAFALLNHHDEPTIKMLAGEASKSLRVGRYKEQELSNIFHSLGKLKHADKEVLDALSKGAIERNAFEFPVQGLAAIINACARLKYFNGDLMEQLCKALMNRQKISKMKETHFASIIVSFARLKYYDAQLMSVLTKPLFKILGHGNFTPKDLANLVYGLGTLGFDDERISYWLIKHLSKGKILAELTPQGFCGVVFGLQRMKVFERGLLNALFREATRKERREKMSERENEFVLASLRKMEEEGVEITQAEQQQVSDL